MCALNELHRILRKNKLKERFVYVPKEAYDSSLPLIKTTQTAAIIGTETHKKKKEKLKEKKILIPLPSRLIVTFSV